MTHPRAIYPPTIAAHYLQHGGKATCVAYQTSWSSLRRWLVEHGVQIRPHGLRMGFVPLTDDQRRQRQRDYDAAYTARNRERKRAAFRRWYYANRQRAIQRVVDWRTSKAASA